MRFLFVFFLTINIVVNAQTIQQTEMLRFRAVDTIINDFIDDLSIEQTSVLADKDSITKIADWFLMDTSDVYTFSEVSLIDLQKSTINELSARRGGVEKLDSVVHAFVGIESIEEWCYSLKSNEIIVKTIGVAPIIKVYDKEGMFKGTIGMFWKKLNEPFSPYDEKDAIHNGDLVVVKKFRNRLHFFDSVDTEWWRNVYDLKIINEESFAKLVYQGAKDEDFFIFDEVGKMISQESDVLTPLDTTHFYEPNSTYFTRMDFKYWFTGIEATRSLYFGESGEFKIEVNKIGPIVNTTTLKRAPNERFSYPHGEYIPFWHYPYQQ